MMVLSSLSPLFILWAARGVPTVKDWCLWTACLLLIGLPNLVLFLRIKLARTRGDTTHLTIVKADDHKEHLLVYLFAVLMPLYDLNFGQRRELFAAFLATAFIVFLFYHLDMYYMNLVFAVLGYRVFTVYPAQAETGFRFSRGDKFVLLTSRPYIGPNQEIDAIRISSSVYFESRSRHE